jgi:hypothetical protein
MTLLFSTLLPGLPTPANISAGMEEAAAFFLFLTPDFLS